MRQNATQANGAACKEAAENVEIVIDEWIETAQVGADCTYAERAPPVRMKLGSL
jgi:hypothetical protein